MKMIHLLLLLSVLLSESPGAAEVLKLVDGQSAPVHISAHSLTRIAMTDGARVVKVLGLGAQVIVHPDAEAGQVFVRPAPGQHEEFSLHVRDDRGATYTLLVIPAELPAGTVYIRPQNQRTGRQESPGQDTQISRIKSWLRLLSLRGVPEGAVYEDHNATVALREEVRLRRTGRVRGLGWLADIYRLQNISGAALQLVEQEFSSLGRQPLAVAVELRQLEPGQRTRVFVLQADE